MAAPNAPADLVAQFVSASAASCCAIASCTPSLGRSGHGAWTFLHAGTPAAGVGPYPNASHALCTLFASAHPLGHGVAGAATGTFIQGPVELSDYKDLYTTSCLTGWTMGNVAASAGDYSLFWAALASGPLLGDKPQHQPQWGLC